MFNQWICVQSELICVFPFRGSYFVYKPGEVLPTEERRQWEIQSFHYNNVAAAMLTLFAVQTTEGWPTYVLASKFMNWLN